MYVCGFTGLSILHRLNALYGFDVLRDLVFDAMHNVPLNVTSHHLHYYFNEGLLTTNDVDRCLAGIYYEKKFLRIAWFWLSEEMFILYPQQDTYKTHGSKNV